VFKKGEIVVKVLVGGGCKTAAFYRVESVKGGVVRLEGVEHLTYSDDNGREIDPAIPGFYSELIHLDGGEDKKINLHPEEKSAKPTKKKVAKKR